MPFVDFPVGLSYLVVTHANDAVSMLPPELRRIGKHPLRKGNVVTWGAVAAGALLDVGLRTRLVSLLVRSETAATAFRV